MSTRPQIAFAVTAENTFSTTVVVDNGGASMFASGTFTGTMTLQGRPGGSSGGWADLATIVGAGATVAVVANAVLPGSWEYRVGCKTGNFTSGTANLILQASNQEGGG
jgi:hypothetical protein